MKSTGIVRKVDELGRVVIPKELRKVLGMNEGDPVEIFTEGEHVILKKYAPACVFCGEAGDVVQYKSKNVCRKCLAELKNE